MGGLLTRQDRPGWYRLALSESGLVIQVMTEFWDTFRVVPSPPDPWRLVRSPEQALIKVPAYTPPGDQAWGFGPVILPVLSEGGVAILRMPWPVIKHQDEPDQVAAYGTTATLGHLWRSLQAWANANPRGARMRDPQLAEITSWSTGVDADLSPTLADWAAGLSSEQLGVLAEMAYRAYAAMWQDRVGQPEAWEFRVDLNVAGIHFSCPGNACGLDPEDSFRPHVEGSGYRLIPHNCDRPWQQLTLLAGIAALCDMYTKEWGGA